MFRHLSFYENVPFEEGNFNKNILIKVSRDKICQIDKDDNDDDESLIISVIRWLYYFSIFGHVQALNGSPNTFQFYQSRLKNCQTIKDDNVPFEASKGKF